MGASSFVLFDDTFIKNSTNMWDGKGGTAVPFLLNNNFSIVEKSDINVHESQGYVLLRKNL
jgi:hypothetical protein